MHQMIALYVVYGIDKLAANLLNMLRAHLAAVKKLAKRVAIHVVGNDAHSQPGHLLEIVDHDDMLMGQVVTHVKFLLNHRMESRIFAATLLQGLEHYPFSIFLGGIDVVELLVPLGKVFYLGPFRLI